MPNRFQPGQRWISEGEPELGLGEVRQVSARTVVVAFKASDEVREFAMESAPLRRVAFRAGDAIKLTDGTTLTVQAVAERDGLLYYACGRQEICETELSSTLSFSSPTDRFLGGRFDAPGVFDLRLAALGHQYRRRKSEVRGFLGGRIDLLPHQLSIASEVTGRLLPRVLLADEVGLGKTIEACLILHRLLLTGRARRVLILVPESLVHQWFLELLRRFNLWFHIYDEARCQAIEDADSGANPFLDNQLLLCDLSLFKDPKRLQQALEAGWDLLVVDEAHHLGWSPEAASPEYVLVEALGRQAAGLLLLTATPEQLGMPSHFARLRLLDPDRFYDLEDFIKESEGYLELAARVEKHRRDHSLPPEEINRLLDQHGTSRVMFRNTRATVSGFPNRLPRLQPLTVPATDAVRFKTLTKEWLADTQLETEAGFHPNYEKDPRIEWLAELLRTSGQDKVLLICHTRRKAEAIQTALKQRITMKLAVFHEGQTLVQRDRGAAWFADRNGARLLICSEIGSEGRNFQFAHHLVLFDLPLDPGLLEQRLGRLDRIGQTSDIQVHVPFILRSHQEVLARWYQEGLDAFAENLQGGRELQERFEPELRALALGFHDQEEAEAAMKGLIEATRIAKEAVALRLEQGRDRLLEWNSFRPEVAKRLIDEVLHQDDQRALDDFMLSIFDLFLVEVEELAPRTYQLGSAGVLVEAFPGLPSEGLTITCDRQRALAREDLQFLTWDHPLVTGAMDLLLGSEQGNSSFARWPDAKASGLYLEVIFLLETIAPPHFHLDRFLPPTPLRILIDHRGLDASSAYPHKKLTPLLVPGAGHGLMEQPEIRESVLPKLLQQSEELAQRKRGGILAGARKEMHARLDQEITRLRDLQKVNRSVRDEEIALLVEQRSAMDEHIAAARLRLDALRLIHRGPLK